MGFGLIFDPDKQGGNRRVAADIIMGSAADIFNGAFDTRCFRTAGEQNFTDLAAAHYDYHALSGHYNPAAGYDRLVREFFMPLNGAKETIIRQYSLNWPLMYLPQSIGIAVGLLLLEKRRNERNLKKLKIPSFLTSLAGLLSLAGLMYMMVMISGYSSFMFKGGQIIATVLSVLVIYALLDQESIFSKIMGISPLSETGKRSYAVYLWHYPFVLLFTNGEKVTLLSAVIVIILTALMTLCSELFVEIPFASGFFKKAFTAAKVKSAKAQARRKRMRVRAFGMMGTYVALIAAAVLCAVFVPRENALANQEELEKQAETAAEMTEQKMKERQEAAEKAKEAEETAANKAQEVTETEAPSETPAAKSDEEICSELDVLLIGDSVSLGASEQFYSVFPNSICDAAVSRYTTESYTIYDIYRYEHGWNGDAVIFALGANGMLYDSLETMREKAGEGRPLFLMSARAPHTDWADINNEEMAAFAKDNPDTYIIDWYGYSEGHPEYFVEDDTHLTPEGAKAYTECIKQALLEHFR